MTRPLPAVPVVLALGSNLGDRVATLRSALRALRRTDGLAVERVSPVVETDPVGGPEQSDYLNAVVIGRTTLPAADLLAACQRIELDHGRVRETRWGPRTLDIDVIAYGTTVSDDPDLTLPHPRAHERAFVLGPWLLVDPDAVLPGPGGGPVQELLAVAGDRAWGQASPRPRPGSVERDEAADGRCWRGTVTASRPRILALLSALATVVGFAAVRMWESSGGGSLPLPWTAVVAMAAIAVSVLALAWPVRQWNAGRRDRALDPLRAARAAVLAKAASHCGALVSGWYLGQGLVLVSDLAIEPRRDRFVLAVVAVLAALVVVAAGLVAEHWCRLPDDPSDDA